MVLSRNIVGCQKGGGCNQAATHVLIYINKTTLKEITEKPKFYCFRHAFYLQTVFQNQERIQSRIYTYKEWMDRVERHNKEKYRSDGVTLRR
jgi:hypothetical protein